MILLTRMSNNEVLTDTTKSSMLPRQFRCVFWGTVTEEVRNIVYSELP